MAVQKAEPTEHVVVWSAGTGKDVFIQNVELWAGHCC